jgi:maleate isomerase
VKDVTNPLVAALAAFKKLSVTRVGLVTPYVMSVNRTLIKAFKEGGVTVTHAGSFEQAEDAKVARIDADSLIQAVTSLVDSAKGGDMFDAVFLSCTNLKTLPVIAEIEEQTGIPCLSSNLCLLWHMMESAQNGAKLNLDVVGSSKLLQA